MPLTADVMIGQSVNLLLFNGGELVDRIVGLQPKSILEQRLERLAAGRQ